MTVGELRKELAKLPADLKVSVNIDPTTTYLTHPLEVHEIDDECLLFSIPDFGRQPDSSVKELKELWAEYV